MSVQVSVESLSKCSWTGCPSAHGIPTIEYLADGEHTSYRGQEQGPGHFELHGNGFDGRATLHMFEGSNILEGGWVEEGAKGMWRIRLG